MLNKKLTTNKLKQILSSKYIRNVGWLGGAELLNRVFRLGTTVTLARMFTPEDYGLMAVIYTLFEFANVFTLRGGIGAKIIQAPEQDVKTICNTSYWLNWILSGSIFIIQCLAASFIADFYGKKQLVLPICVAAITYLMLPLYMVHLAIIERENRLKITALCNAAQSLVNNTITVILALLGMGVWSIVWAMVLTTPLWIIITWRNHDWRPPKSFSLEGWRKIAGFGGNLLGIELLNKIKGNIDYLIVGRFLGVEALGIYYFAFNAGLGISMNVINTFNSALFPYLCEVSDNTNLLRKRFFSSLKKICIVTFPLIILQSSLAPFYVPIIFGQKWTTAIPILVLICLSALPIPIDNAVYHLLNAIGKPRISLYWNLIKTLTFSILALFVVKWGILAVAILVTTFQFFTTPLFSIWAIKYTLKSRE
ncbi:lipopolysaccharide biosynthesis protein [Rivularia sp. UHCC 0363]|uniref:lipopolysaccharide biosynthesis protein n=1 Tax=Rivularia sp. UHCC 0363 TaxID=3110244 RepID=UPI002B216058|nr:lipopolysaccharide biosynthesis protein [Rivularia sp. UHCC 0363]MEA5593798.1 lipopolysaccharide biosynthesis protein [Rivularia sp. UHCC 0363]